MEPQNQNIQTPQPGNSQQSDHQQAAPAKRAGLLTGGIVLPVVFFFGVLVLSVLINLLFANATGDSTIEPFILVKIVNAAVPYALAVCTVWFLISLILKFMRKRP